MVTTGFAEAISERMSSEHALLAARWFARLRELLPVDPNDVFPSDSLLDHIPSLIVDISTYLKAPEEEAIVANTLVGEKARELGTLRHQQRASLHQVMREYQLLGSILLRFVEEESVRMQLTPPPAECVALVVAAASARLACCCKKPSRRLSASIRRPSPTSPNGSASSPGWRRTNGDSRSRRSQPPCPCYGCPR